MASLAPLLRRSVATARITSKALKGGGSTPPMPPHVRIPPPTEPLTENHDCLFDDACAPELALDFDAPNVSTSEGFATWLSAFSALGTLLLTIKYVGKPEVSNPAVTRGESDDLVVSFPQHK